MCSRSRSRRASRVSSSLRRTCCERIYCASSTSRSLRGAHSGAGAGFHGLFQNGRVDDEAINNALAQTVLDRQHEVGENVIGRIGRSISGSCNTLDVSARSTRPRMSGRSVRPHCGPASPRCGRHRAGRSYRTGVPRRLTLGDGLEVGLLAGFRDAEQILLSARSTWRGWGRHLDGILGQFEHQPLVGKRGIGKRSDSSARASWAVCSARAESTSSKCRETSVSRPGGSSKNRSVTSRSKVRRRSEDFSLASATRLFNLLTTAIGHSSTSVSHSPRPVKPYGR